MEHGGTARQHNVLVQILPNVNVAAHDGVIANLVDAVRFHTEQLGLEEHLWCTEALAADGDHLAEKEQEMVVKVWQS